MIEGVQLVEKSIEVEVRCCRTCNGVGVGSKHRCPKPRKARKGDSAIRGLDVVVPIPSPDCYLARVAQTRWFWQLPFNPDAPAQILAYIASHGESAPEHKKTKKPTTAKEGLKALAKKELVTYRRAKGARPGVWVAVGVTEEPPSGMLRDDQPIPF